MKYSSNQVVARVFREEYGKLMSVLMKFLGPSRMETAEDVVQETLLTAVEHWARNDIPDAPTAWLVQVAKRKALNLLKREQVALQALPAAYEDLEVSMEDSVFGRDEIADSQLRMIFTCCHPELPKSSQIALTLKTLCGLGVKEVSRALLTTDAVVNKRLYRAKRMFRESKIDFQIPSGKELYNRLDAVLVTLYLLFNEGYNSTSAQLAIRKDLCLEAIRLTRLLLDHFKAHKKLWALLALMCFHVARFDARIDDNGAIVLFQDQNRLLWNSELIAKAMGYLQLASGDTNLSTYHLEACIAAEHCLSSSFKTTKWKDIYGYYELLWKLKPSPVIKLNLAIIQSQISGHTQSLRLLAELEQDKILSTYYLLPATQGAFQMEVGSYKSAIQYFQKSLLQSPSPVEKAHIEQKMEVCRKRLQKS